MGANPVRGAILTEYADLLIKSKARKLCLAAGCSRSDWEDFVQELRLRLLEKEHLYDPARGAIDTFAAQIIQSQAAMILRERNRLKRAAGYAAVSLDSPSDQADRSFNDCQTEATQISVEQWELVQHVKFSEPRARAIMRRILDGNNVAQVARDLGCSRPAIYRVLQAQRDRFLKAGFGPGRTRHCRSVRRRSA